MRRRLDGGTRSVSAVAIGGVSLRRAHTSQVLDETEKVIHSEDMFAPVGLLRVAKCHTEPKDQGLPRGVFLHGGDDADVKDRRGAPGVLRREREGEEARRGGGKDVDRSQQEGDAGRAAGDDTGREGSQEVGQGKGGNKAAGGSQAAAALREVAVGSEVRCSVLAILYISADCISRLDLLRGSGTRCLELLTAPGLSKGFSSAWRRFVA